MNIGCSPLNRETNKIETTNNKQPLTTYCRYDDRVFPAIESYNKTSDETHKFQIKMANRYDFNGTGLSLSTKLLSGGGLDAMLFSQKDFCHAKAYMASGIFQDLNPRFEKSSLAWEDYNQMILWTPVYGKASAILFPTVIRLISISLRIEC